MAEETASVSQDQLSQIINQLLAGKTAQPAVDPNAGPSSREGRGILSLLGEGLGGGAQYGSATEREQGGLSALGAAGARMLQASDWSVMPHTFGSILGQGLDAARGNLGHTQAVSAAQHYAAQQMAHQQQEDQIARLKEALPYLKLKQEQDATARMRAASGDTPTSTSIGAAGDYTVPTELLPAYKAAAEKYGVPVELLIAQHKQESNLNPGATGGAGEVGLGQILPATAKSPGFGMAGADLKALRDPAANIDFSAQYLAARAKAAGADLKTPEGVVKALKAYNGGGDPNYVQNVTRYIPGAQKALAGQRADATPGGGTVQAAGDAAPTSGVIPALPPQAAAASAADVAQIEAGRAEARTSMAGGPGQGTMVAGPPGTVPPAMPPAPEFRMRPLTPTEQTQTSYALDPKVQRNINALKAGAYTTEMMKAALVEESNAIAAQRTKADAARLAIEKDARQDWLKQNSPATDAHLAAGGMMREPGVQYLVDNAGNITTKAIPVDPRVAARAEAESKRYETDYAEPYDKIRPVHQLLNQMEALDKKIKSDSFGGRGTVGSSFAQSVQKTLSGLGLASDSITDATANQEAYAALHNQLVLKLKGLSGTSLGNTSNTDLVFLDNQAPSLNLTAEGRARTTAAMRQILSHQGRLYEIATDSLHDPNNNGTMRDLHERLAKEPPAIPTFPGRNASAADAKAWMEHNKPRRGTAYYNSRGDLAIWGVDPLE